jgi:hypothetical protein
MAFRSSISQRSPPEHSVQGHCIEVTERFVEFIPTLLELLINLVISAFRDVAKIILECSVGFVAIILITVLVYRRLLYGEWTWKL